MECMSLIKLKNYINKNKLEEIKEESIDNREKEFYILINSFIAGEEITVGELLNKDIDYINEKIAEIEENDYNAVNKNYSIATDLLISLLEIKNEYKLNTKLLF